MSNNQMKTICLHHSDSDGRASATVVANSPHKIDTFVEIDYGYNSNDLLYKLADYDKIFIVDFSLSDKEMDLLLKQKKEIIWIDHHESATKKKYWLDNDVKGLRNIGESGCLLAWKFFNPDMPSSPALIRYVNDYDLWKLEYKDMSKWLNEAIKLLTFKDNQDTWALLLKNEGLVKQKIMEGQKLFERKELEAVKIAKQGREALVKGIPLYAVNAADNFNNIAIESMKLGYDIAAVYWVDKDIIRVTMRSNDDSSPVNEIAEKFTGGGGHKRAAGFEVPYKKGINSIFKWV